MHLSGYEIQKVWTLDDDVSLAIAYVEDLSELMLFQVNWDARQHSYKTMSYKEKSWSLTSSGIESAKFFGTSTTDFYFLASAMVNIDSSVYTESNALQGLVFTSQATRRTTALLSANEVSATNFVDHSDIVTRLDASTATSSDGIYSLYPYRAYPMYFGNEEYTLQKYSDVDVDSDRCIKINMGPQGSDPYVEFSSIQVSNGDRVRSLLPVYEDLEGDPIQISFSNVENWVLSTTFYARVMVQHSTYNEYALMSEPIIIDENALVGSSTITVTYTDMNTG